MMMQIIHAFGALGESVFYNHKGFLAYLSKAVILSLLVVSGLVFGGWKMVESLGDYVTKLIPGTWAYESLTISIVSFLISSVVAFVLLKYIVLIILGPSLSNISSYAESTDKPVSQYGLGSISRSILITLRNISKEIGYTAILLLLSFIPFVGFFALTMIFVLQAYYAGCGVFDYYLERYHSYSETILVCKKNRYAAFAIGTVFVLLLLIPVIGVVIAPYITTVAGTKYFERYGSAA